MLILAGVSINAIVGDNGVLTRTQYASFLNEMAAVEEAVQLWKTGESIEANGEESKAIPVKGLCKANELMETERLVGEVGYYRIWSMSETQPITNILSSASDFNNAFESELIFYPAGVQDLYYLNNEALGIKDNKTYLIEAATGMIYSMTGIGLKGVRCYSSSMAKAVMNGENTAPVFAEAEVSGIGTGDKLAGNVTSKYLYDENGNLMLNEDGTPKENPEYNPNGFRIIADSSNNNIYKLYNNGDLYGKGIKGFLMNSTEEEMTEINEFVWNKFTVPSNIPGASNNNITIIPGDSTIYVIDENKELWAWGLNNSNKLGLTDNQQVEYTGLVPTKLDVDGKKVEKVWPNKTATYVLTKTDNIYELYACGYNVGGQLGTGFEGISQEAFMKVDIDTPEKIINITNNAGKDTYNLILMKDETKNKIFFAGSTSVISGYSSSSLVNIFKNTDLANTKVTKYIEIFNGNYGQPLPYNVVNLYRGENWNATNINLITSNGNLYKINSEGNINEVKINSSNVNISKFKSSSADYAIFTMKVGDINQIYCINAGTANIFGDANINSSWKLLNTYFPTSLNPNEIKDFCISNGCVFYLMNDGKVFASGSNSGAGVGISTGDLNNIVCLQEISNLPLIDNFENSEISGDLNFILLRGKDGCLYGTGNSIIMFGEKILQKNWKKIAANVKKFNAMTTGNSLAYIDYNNDLWILGADSSYFGINQQGLIRNFVRVKDYLKGTEMYNHIDGKIEDYVLGSNSLRILTNASDNSTIYVSGYYKTNTWYQYNGLGVAGTDNHFEFVKVIDNIKIYSGKEASNFAISKDNKLYSWGFFDGNGSFGSLESVKELTIPEDTNLMDVNFITNNHHYNKFICIDNKLYVAGYGAASSTVNGLGFNTNNNFTKFPNDDFGTRNVVDVVSCSNASWIVLTDDGNIWGCGRNMDLGVGKTDAMQNFSPIQVYSNSDIAEITGGNNWFIAVTKDGKVYGTGSNTYGILGRWIGIDRKQPNSRYKTAFEWVECPELEI